MKNYIPDKLKKLPCGSLIQHGKFNDRIYLIKTGKNASETLSTELIDLAKEKGYSKIFAKVPFSLGSIFFNAGFIEEGKIPNLYNGRETVLFLGYFLDPKRKKETSLDEIENIKHLALNKAAKQVTIKNIEDNFIIRKCKTQDAKQISQVYKQVYISYPFPIDDPEYISETMDGNFSYFCVEDNEKIVALSSYELFPESKSVEMTDFATLPDYRSRGLAGRLLLEMEKQVREKGYKTAFTVARAISAGMNITFAKNGYSYGGRLKNNTNISGQIESMNIWYKKL